MSEDKQTDNQPALQPPELLPCPLCGSTNLFLRDIAGWELDCRNCELSLVLADDPSREGLIARWNTRARVRDGVLATVDEPADMTDDELMAARRFHEQQAWRYSREAAKIWRLRLRTGNAAPIDQQMFAELTERRAKKKPSLKQHALRLINEIRECPNGMCEHCQDVLFNELESFLKTVEIVLPKKSTD